MIPTTFERLRVLVGSAPFVPHATTGAVDDDALDFEHYRWSVYESALACGAEQQLLDAIGDEPEVVLQRAVLWELLERPLWASRALTLVPEGDAGRDLRRHALEVNVLADAVAGRLGNDADSSAWSNWLQRAICAHASDEGVLRALAERGFGRHVRAQAASRLRELARG